MSTMQPYQQALLVIARASTSPTVCPIGMNVLNDDTADV